MVLKEGQVDWHRTISGQRYGFDGAVLGERNAWSVVDVQRHLGGFGEFDFDRILGQRNRKRVLRMNGDSGKSGFTATKRISLLHVSDYQGVKTLHAFLHRVR